MSLANKTNEVLGFGFGVIDNWVFVYAASTLVTGIGAGMLFASLPLTELTRTTIVAVALIVAGTIAANLAHSVLKRKARQQSSQAAELAATSPNEPGNAVDEH